MLASIFFILVVTFVILIYLIRRNLNYWKNRSIRGPKPKLFCGNFPKTSAGLSNLVEELHEIYLRYKGSEKFVGVIAARKPKLFILDPKLAIKILTKNFSHFHDNESSKWTSPRVDELRLSSPFVSTGDEWKEKRSELVPSLTANRIRAFYDILRQCGEEMTEYIESRFNQAMDIKELSNRFTAEFIANFIWGIKADAFNILSQCIIHKKANLMIAQALECVRYYGKAVALLRHIKPVPFFPETTDQFFKQLAADVMQLRKNSTLQRCDVINHLLQLREKKGLSDTQIAGHTTTVLIDGFETVAIVIAHCLLLLARNERVQTKLRKELTECPDNISFDALNELPYLDHCLQETLRLFPPLPTLFKLCTKPITLVNNDGTELRLEPNDVVYISTYSFHHDPDYFINPREFRPERFDDEFGGVRKYQEMGVFLPFGNGPRICPGLKLGLSVAKVAIAKLTETFIFSPTEKTRKDNKLAADSFLLCLDEGIELTFQKVAV